MSVIRISRPTFALTVIAAACSLAVSAAWAAPATPAVPNGPGTPATPAVPAHVYAAGNLLVSRAVYDPRFTVSGTISQYNGNPTGTGTAATPVVAVTPGTFPNVFTNDANDANFGITAEVFLDQWLPGATSAARTTSITAAAAARNLKENFTTSFPSKSELGMTVSLDKKSITFMGYNAAINQIDVSNSNTPGVIDSTNTDVATPTYRTVAQLDFDSGKLMFTHTNAYSGNNGRGAVLANGMYYMVGNAGNSGSNPNPTYGGLDTLTMDTGVQSIAPGSDCPFTQVIGTFYSGNGSTYTPASAGTACSLDSLGTITDPLSATIFAKKTNAGGNQFGFTLASLAGQAYDKTGKDDNFRGLFVGPDGTLYVTKGSGGNGVNTVYQVGAAGALANGQTLPQTAPITIVPGFTTVPASDASIPQKAAKAPATTNYPTPIALATGTQFPFGGWMPASEPTLMFIGDEGDGFMGDQQNGSGGLWVYQKTGSTWAAIAHVTTGLNLGTTYTVTDTEGTYGTVGAGYTTTPDGLRNITGQVNSDGSFTIFAVTSTIGNSLGANFDAGADSNQLVKATLTVKGNQVTTSGFTVMQTAPFGQVLRGVTMVPSAS